MIQQTCRCGKVYSARAADIKRGWGKSCSKECAARKRTSREASGNFRIAEASAKYSSRIDQRISDDDARTAFGHGWDDQKNS